jgi:GntR family transcriptional regulator
MADVDIDIKIDRSLSTPAYLQLKEGIEKAVKEGALRSGEALPSERDLAERLGLSRMTIRRALEALAEGNIIERRHGSGTYVLPHRLEQHIDKVLGFTEEAQVLGFSPGSQLLEAVRVAADAEVARFLEIEPGNSVLRITRLRSADGEPLAIQESHLAPRLDLPIEALQASGSLYKSLAAHHGLKPHHAKQLVSARLPSANEARRLGIRRNVPLLALVRITFDDAGKPFEYVRSAYRSDKYQLALELHAPDEA